MRDYFSKSTIFVKAKPISGKTIEIHVENQILLVILDAFLLRRACNNPKSTVCRHIVAKHRDMCRKFQITSSLLRVG